MQLCVVACPPTGLTVLVNCVVGFGWIRWVSLLLPTTSESNSFIQLSLKEIVGGGRGDRMIAFDLVFDRTSILFVEPVVHRPSSPFPDVFSTSSACTMQDVVWSNQAHADLCAPNSWD